MAPEPEADGAGMADRPEHGPAEPQQPAAESVEQWGDGGLVGDGRYRLTHRLGRGGMAEVFAAEDVRLGRTVAVKLLRSDLAEDPVSKMRFTREAQSVAGLNHHAVVAVYDSGEDRVGPNTVPYIVMELVEGRTIRDLLISAEPPGPDQALIIVSGVLEALAYSHQHGIVHRDIKPANVIITHTGAVKVMDFGIARALHSVQSTMTQTGMVMGTPQYLSPEQALGKAVDHRSDLYATGCLLYELLTGRPPFTGETPLSVVYQHVQDAPVPPSQMAPGLPAELDGLVMRALAKDADDRFQSAEEMRGIIQYALQMLQEQGGHTGTWNTGPATMHLPHRTAVMGVATGPQPQYPGHATSQFGPPMVPPMNPEDGGFAGGGGGYHEGAPSGGGRWKMWLFAVVAMVAIAGGITYALDRTGQPDTSGNTGTTGGNTQIESPQAESGAPSPTPSPSAKTREREQTSTSGNSGWTPNPKPTKYPPTTDPTQPTTDPTDPTQEPTDPPTDPTQEPTQEPTPPTQKPTPPDGGADGGGSAGSAGDANGGADAGGSGTTP
ncbi:protein kinase [Streptomyces sp. NPDC006879]|uniref:protein kinase domain-containing protein n=1 Tax=Streptomyces sp. NPDC006879 TaxID=3364767 RepID=UPI0036B80282